MQYTFLKDLLGSPWQIEAHTFNSMYPIFSGMLNGMKFEREEIQIENQPHLYAPGSGRIAAEEEEATTQKVVSVIVMRDVMTKHDQPCGPRGTRFHAQRLRDYDKQEEVIGHTIILESGGGQAIAVAEMADAISECTKPVVVWVDGMMGSAAYYIGSYANEIIASRENDRIGCIGTMCVYEGRKAVSEADSFGVVQVRIYADGSEEKNEEYEEAINNNNFQLVKDRVLNPLNATFLEDVRTNRPGAKDEHLKGRTFAASEVLGSLIDSIGDFDSAISRVLDLAGYEENGNNTGQSAQSSQAENNNLNTSSMELTNIQNVLGGATLEFESDDRRTFTQEEMESIETALGNNNSQELQTKLDTANQTIAGQKTQISNLQKGAGAATTQVTKESDTTVQEESEFGQSLSSEDVEMFNALKS